MSSYFNFRVSRLTGGSNRPIKNSNAGVVSRTQAVALGLGSLFKHSTLDQNVEWKRDVKDQCIVYRALRDIKAGEELCIDYGRLWFADADEEKLGQGNDDNDDFLTSIEIFE
ncbi:hypothetical protein N7G274_009912 [Stereocaulon virgatum]|uniref:SET domain-containing protein n=1 Tax=Stereocaulon virgatum TaxID=373712 RepID=A0ABR3ZZB6_9LECA